MQVDVLNTKGEKTGRTVELPEEIFNIEPNDHCIYLAVKQYLAAQRQGTHKTKTRAEVQGSTKKLHRQKGTGGSRKGNIRNPLYKGGGRVNGPLPHGYGFKLNRKVKILARNSALTYKAKDGKIVVVEDMKMDAPKTKDFAAMLNSVQAGTPKTLFIIPEHDANVILSSRNLPRTTTVLLNDINTYDLTNAQQLIFTEGAVNKVNEYLKEMDAVEAEA